MREVHIDLDVELSSHQFYFLFQYVMSGKGRMAYNKAPTKRKLRKMGKVK